jgi:integrase
MDEVIALMSVWTNVYKTHKPKGSIESAYRDSLLILLYVLTGARSAEVVKIKLKEISLFSHNSKEYYSIKILEGKGDKIREVGVEAGFIKQHIEHFKSVLPDDDFYLSSSFSHGSYLNKSHHPDTIRRFGNYILQVLGINKKGLHTFRRGYATRRVVEDGVDISIVAKEMGNSSSVLERYYLKHSARMGQK